MVNFKNTVFIKSAPTIKDAPIKRMNEILFVGKSNVGKSSLINAICDNSSLAYTSSKPGFTKLLNFYNVDQKFYLVDAPGYGYTLSGTKHVDSFGEMMENVFDSPFLKGVAFLLDSRLEFSQNDIDFYNFIVEKRIKFILVMTKTDKLNQSELHKAKMNVTNSFVNLSEEDVVYVSVKNLKTVDRLKKIIASFAL